MSQNIPQQWPFVSGPLPKSDTFCYWHRRVALLPLCHSRIVRFTLLFTAFCVTSTIAPLWGEAPSVSTTPPQSAGPAPAVSTTPPTSNAGEAPVTIRADGQNTYVGEIATADDNVVVHYKDDVLFADHVVFDRATRVMIATGNARLFSATAESIAATASPTISTPRRSPRPPSPALIIPGSSRASRSPRPGFNHYRLTNAIVHHEQPREPQLPLEASTIEYRPNDEVVLKNVVALHRRRAGVLLSDLRAIAHRFASGLPVPDRRQRPVRLLHGQQLQLGGQRQDARQRRVRHSRKARLRRRRRRPVFPDA